MQNSVENLRTENHQLQSENQRLKQELENLLSKNQSYGLLGDAQQSFKLVTDNIQEGLIMVDNDDVIVFVNPMFCKLFKYNEKALMGKICAKTLFDEKDWKLIQQKNIERKQGITERYEIEIVSGENERIPVLLNASPVYDNHGIIQGSMAVCTDLSNQKHVEAELRQEKAFFKQLYDFAPIGIVLLDNDDRIIDMNSEFVELFGYSRIEMIGKQINTLIVPNELIDESWHFTSLVSEGKFFSQETIRIKKGGEQVHVSIIGKPIMLNNTQVAVYGMYQNITRRKKFEKAINEKNEFLNILKDYSLQLASVNTQENIYQLVCKQLKDYLGSFTVMLNIYHEDTRELELVFSTFNHEDNKYIVRLLGRKLEGYRVSVSPEMYQKINSQVACETNSLYDTTFGTMPAPVAYMIEKTLGIQWLTGLALQYESKLIGTILIVGNKKSRRPELDNMAAYAAISANAIRRWLVTKDLIREKEHYQILIKSMSQGLVTFESVRNKKNEITDFSFVDVNPAFEKRFGKERAYLEGKLLRDTFDVIPDELFEKFVSVLETGHPYYTDNFSLFNYMYELVAFKTRENQIAIVVTDVTERHQSQKLREEVAIAHKSVEFKQKFLANMSHEIRTPLTGIIGMVDIMAKTRLNPIQEDYLNSIRFSSENLREIINQILDYSKIEAGKFTLSKKAVEFDKIIHNTTDLFHSICKKNLDFRIERDPHIPKYIVTDEKRVFQVITNLLSNAVKFTDHGGILVKTKMGNTFEDGTFSISMIFEDSGIGISKVAQQKLFAPFVDVESDDRRNSDGTGLGLSISKELAHILGGGITLVSESGKGSAFTFCFSTIAGIIEEHEKALLEGSIIKSETKPLSILLVEDKHINQKVISLMLESLGHQVQIASNGQEALDIFKPGIFDLILMDIQMPVMDGITCTQNLKSEYQLLPPIVGLSANAFEGDREKYMALGLDEYLTKPIRTDDFERMVSVVFR